MVENYKIDNDLYTGKVIIEAQLTYGESVEDLIKYLNSQIQLNKTSLNTDFKNKTPVEIINTILNKYPIKDDE